MSWGLKKKSLQLLTSKQDENPEVPGIERGLKDSAKSELVSVAGVWAGQVLSTRK